MSNKKHLTLLAIITLSMNLTNVYADGHESDEKPKTPRKIEKNISSVNSDQIMKPQPMTKNKGQIFLPI